MTGNSGQTDRLLRRAAQGDSEGWGALVAAHRDRLRRMVAMRLDRRLQGRIDASDVIQEAYLEAWTRLAEYVRSPPMPFFLWLRFLVAQKLLTLHRHHLGRRMRDPAREIRLAGGAMPEASSAALAARLLGNTTRPSEAAMRKELSAALQKALSRMDGLDREVLALRHFEQLNRAETAQVLGIQEGTAASRYLRALKRLKEILVQMGLGEAQL